MSTETKTTLSAALDAVAREHEELLNLRAAVRVQATETQRQRERAEQAERERDEARLFAIDKTSKEVQRVLTERAAAEARATAAEGQAQALREARDARDAPIIAALLGEKEENPWRCYSCGTFLFASDGTLLVNHPRCSKCRPLRLAVQTALAAPAPPPAQADADALRALLGEARPFVEAVLWCNHPLRARIDAALGGKAAATGGDRG